MPTPRGLGCCALERSLPEARVRAADCLQHPPQMLAATSGARGTVLGAETQEGDLMTGESRKLWQGWLQEWEERQRAQLEQHEEVTRERVDALKREVLEKLEQLKAPQARRHLPQALPKVSENGQEEKQRLLDGHKPAAARHSPTTSSLQGSSYKPANGHSHALINPSMSLHPVSMNGLNDAMMSAIGGQKAARSETDGSVSSPHTTYTASSTVEQFKPSNRLQTCLSKIVHTQAFDITSGVIIIIYTVVVGVISDLDMRAAVNGEEAPTWRYYVDLGFTCFFIMEIMLRWLAEGLYFFKGSDRSWNIFDLLVSVAGLLDLFMVFEVNLGFLRILRTCRAFRVLRVIRIFRFFKELRLMIASIMCCMVSLSWAFTLLVAVVYIFAIVLLQGASDFLHSELPHVEDELLQALTEDFGDLLRTVFSLTQAVSGGRSWGEYAAPFIRIGAWYGVCFTVFVIFVIFGVLNILTGVFVESTSAVATFDRELVIQEEMSRNESVVNQMRALFREIDVDNSGTITYKELTRNLKDERVKAYFSVLQMDVSEAQGLFQLLDRDESGEVSIEEFIMTCMRLKGNARSIDLATMLFESKRLHSMLKTFMGHMSDNIRFMRSQLNVICDAPALDPLS